MKSIVNHPLFTACLLVQAVFAVVALPAVYSQTHCIDKNNKRLECKIQPINGAIFAVTHPGKNYYAEIINETANGACFITFIDKETRIINQSNYYQTDEMSCSKDGNQYTTTIEGEDFIYVFQ